jgi:flagellar hook protein FlgE
MIDSIFVALSGMQGHQRGLNVISNNVANMNTPGFRGSTVSFADVFIGASPNGLGGQQALGGGLNASLTVMDLRAGEPQQTGNDLDLRLQGSGFFILQDENGAIRYTRNGSFEFDADGVLVARGQRLKVMARNAAGELAPVDIRNLLKSSHKATSELTFDRFLSRGEDEQGHTIDSVVVFDQQGSKHTLKLEFRKDSSSSPVATVWNMTVFEGATEIGAGQLRFDPAGIIEPGTSPLSVLLALNDTEAAEIKFNFDTVSGADIGTSSTMAVTRQDGFAAGEISRRTFDDRGVLKLTYSNGQQADGPTLSLAVIANEAQLVQVGNSMFEYRGLEPAVVRAAGDDLSVLSQSLERSNVDLTEEFSELILTQRGYQASSQVVSTANDMLQELLELRSRK